MTAAIYARKSTEQNDVATEATSVARQVDGARAFIATRGWTLHPAHIYKDDGVSGALFLGRPAFQRMLRDAEAGAFEAIVFFDLDRFGRNGRRSMEALYRLRDLGIAIWDYSTGLAVNLDTFEGRITTSLKAEFAQQFREQIRKHTREAMRRKAEQGYVTGGLTFGYDNVGPKGQRVRQIKEAEAAVVRDIFRRFAEGQGIRSIAAALNAQGALKPRAQQGRRDGWSVSTIRCVLERPLYRGTVVFGRTAALWGHELGRGHSDEDHAQMAQPQEHWITREVPELRIVDEGLAEQCDRRRREWRRRCSASPGHTPQRAHGKYLLSGGLLVCSTCKGHFTGYVSPWTHEAVYLCGTRRQKPGTCSNSLRLPMAETDEAVLEIVAGEVLAPSMIDELLAMVDRGQADTTARDVAERDRLQQEVQNLVEAIAKGVARETVVVEIRRRQAEIATLNARLTAPRREPPNMERLRQALTLRAEEWKATLQSEPKVGRLLLKRLLDPIELWDADRTVKSPEWIAWETSIRPQALLESEGAIEHMASPSGLETIGHVEKRRVLRAA
jgi:DNA invertase Pin-like site-specific DNA recombinase